MNALTPAILAFRKSAKAFRKANSFVHVNLGLSEPAYGVQADMVYVYDNVAGHFTTCHSLSAEKQAQVLAAAR